MRLNHSAMSIGPAVSGLFVLGLFVLGLVTGIETAAASDCPCIKGSAGVCVPDLACEARERQMRDRLMHDLHQHEQKAVPHSGTMMRIERPTTTAAPAPPPAPPPPAPPPTAAARPPSPPPPAIRPADAPARVEIQPPAVGSGMGRVHAARAAPGGRLRILETGYSHLSELGKEDEGYGLYSYAILPSESRRAEVFLSQLFTEIPSIGDTSAQRSQLNIFYVPLKKDREGDFAALLQTSASNAEKLGAEYSRSFYDYRIARALLDHVCNPPADSIRRLCDGDLSRGPYIFTYASPASSMDSVPPPFLFVDLSNVHEQAFGEFIAAFRSQVKRDDITDQARIRTMRLTILDIVLTAADWVSPVEKAIAEIVHSPSDDKK